METQNRHGYAADTVKACMVSDRQIEKGIKNMTNKEVKELLKLLSQAINICDRLNLEYGDELMEMIADIKETFGIDD